jgi:hypothetical protein
VLRWLRAFAEAKLDGYALAVGFLLAQTPHRVSYRTGVTQVSVDYLREQTGWGQDRICTTLARLTSAGWLVQLRRHGAGRARTWALAIDGEVAPGIAPKVAELFGPAPGADDPPAADESGSVKPVTDTLAPRKSKEHVRESTTTSVDVGAYGAGRAGGTPPTDEFRAGLAALKRKVAAR